MAFNMYSSATFRTQKFSWTVFFQYGAKVWKFSLIAHSFSKLIFFFSCLGLKCFEPFTICWSLVYAPSQAYPEPYGPGRVLLMEHHWISSNGFSFWSNFCYFHLRFLMSKISFNRKKMDFSFVTCLFFYLPSGGRSMIFCKDGPGYWKNMKSKERKSFIARIDQPLGGLLELGTLETFKCPFLFSFGWWKNISEDSPLFAWDMRIVSIGSNDLLPFFLLVSMKVSSPFISYFLAPFRYLKVSRNLLCLA